MPEKMLLKAVETVDLMLLTSPETKDFITFHTFVRTFLILSIMEVMIVFIVLKTEDITPFIALTPRISDKGLNSRYDCRNNSFYCIPHSRNNSMYRIHHGSYYCFYRIPSCSQEGFYSIYDRHKCVFNCVPDRSKKGRNRSPDRNCGSFYTVQYAIKKCADVIPDITKKLADAVPKIIPRYAEPTKEHFKYAFQHIEDVFDIVDKEVPGGKENALDVTLSDLFYFFVTNHFS